MLIVSEYGIVPVHRPVHINRALREAGLLAVRDEEGGELLDPPQSRAFAVADHQVAHVYVPTRPTLPRCARSSSSSTASTRSRARTEKRAHGLDHERSGELVALAEPDAWFTYYYWLDDARAPDFARTVEIHRKPGYDPVELFLDPAIRFPKLAIGWRLLEAHARFAYADGRDPARCHARARLARARRQPAAHGPLVMSSEPALLPEATVDATDVKQLMLDHIFGAGRD